MLLYLCGQKMVPFFFIPPFSKNFYPLHITLFQPFLSMKKSFYRFLILGTACASLASCSKSNYAFNPNTPAYLGSERVHSAVAIAPVPDETMTASTEAAPLVATTSPAYEAAQALTHRATASHAVAPVAAPQASATQHLAVTKADRKAVKQGLKRELAAAPKGMKAEGKSQLVALILSFFLGVLGIHRFYLGYTGLGILELLTFGVFGILSLIDFIRIILGTLKPKGGEYAKKL
ncbi:TM2 domain-containing protein [Hymenobacter nivis]|nr:TM2 domain-containing protein [Hymenobacter nivis]